MKPAREPFVARPLLRGAKPQPQKQTAMTQTFELPRLTVYTSASNQLMKLVVPVHFTRQSESLTSHRIVRRTAIEFPSPALCPSISPALWLRRLKLGRAVEIGLLPLRRGC
jgi:hypothetical protein